MDIPPPSPASPSPPPPASPPTPPHPHLGLQASDRLIYQGDRVDLVLRPVMTHSGQKRMREACLHRGAVIILPIAEDGRLVLIRNRRHTVGEELLELPAGTLEYAAPPGRAGDPVENPAAAAARELTEETGYAAREMEPFGWFYTSPGILTEKMYAFVARGLTAGEQDLEENEQIEVVLYTAAEILELIRENRLVDAKSIAVLLKYLVSGCRSEAGMPAASH